MSQGIFRSRRQPLSFGIHLIAGAVGVLAGLQHLLFAKGSSTGTREAPAAAETVSLAKAESAEKRRDYFSIRRTKSELGYVYWILQGYGEFQCFVLFDTWREAVDEASRRISDFGLKSLSPLSVPRTASMTR